MADGAWDTLWIDARLATMTAGGAPYGAVEDGALAVSGGRIAWIGARSDLPDAAPATVVSAGGRWITPGLIDAHTHIVHGGDRAREFELRLEGASYEEIARAGGGIRSTVAATRAADEDALLASALPRLDALLAEGVTVIEVKSGYGLETSAEARMLRAARRLGEARPVTVVTSFLGAHAIPPEFEGRADAYVDSVIEEQLPAVAEAGLADAVDAFVERIAFSADQIDRVFSAARARGLPVRLHADQLSDGGGAALAARHGARSADHLEYASQDGVAALAAAGTVAMLLPAAYYFLRETTAPPVAAFRAAGVPMALATDCNPGAAPATSLLLMLNMAATLFRMTPEEALAGVTRNAARALGLDGERGTLEVGKAADFVLWDVTTPAQLAYRIGFNPCAAVVRAGAVVRGEEALA